VTAHRKWLRVGLLCLATTSAPAGSLALAQTYPTGPVKFLTQLGTGGGTDPVMRIVIEQLGRMWGQQTILVNQPGAGGALAARAAHSAAPDGHTLYMAIASTFTVLPQLQPDLPFTGCPSEIRCAERVDTQYDSAGAFRVHHQREQIVEASDQADRARDSIALLQRQ
jgi:Tripartite tricarboxylate transporter family receptor